MARRGPTATFTAIADDLRQRIARGEFNPGDKLPPMRLLAEQYGVAGATMDRALNLLKDERLIEGKAGAGTYVSSRPAHLWASDSLPFLTPRPRGARDAWSEETANRGRRGTQRLLEVAEVEPPDDVAEALGLGSTEKAIIRRRLLRLDDVPVEIVDSYYPATVARGTPLAENKKIKGGAVTCLAELGHVAHEVCEDVTSRMPRPNEQELLEMGDDTPLLVLYRVVSDASGTPFEVSIMAMPADRRRLKYTTKLG